MVETKPPTKPPTKRGHINDMVAALEHAEKTIAAAAASLVHYVNRYDKVRRELNLQHQSYLDNSKTDQQTIVFLNDQIATLQRKIIDTVPAPGKEPGD